MFFARKLLLLKSIKHTLVWVETDLHAMHIIGFDELENESNKYTFGVTAKCLLLGNNKHIFFMLETRIWCMVYPSPSHKIVFVDTIQYHLI